MQSRVVGHELGKGKGDGGRRTETEGRMDRTTKRKEQTNRRRREGPKEERKRDGRRGDRQTQGVLSCRRQTMTALFCQLRCSLRLWRPRIRRGSVVVSLEEKGAASCEPLLPVRPLVNYCSSATLATAGFIWRIEMVACVTSESSRVDVYVPP